MKQQFAIGAKKSGAVAAVVRLPEVGRNQSVGSCLCTDQSVDQKFVSLSSVLQGGGGPWLGPGTWTSPWHCLTLAMSFLRNYTTYNSQHTNPPHHTTSIIDSRPSRNPSYPPGSSSRCQPRCGIAGSGTHRTRFKFGSHRSLILLIMEFLTSFRGLPLPLRM